MKAEYLKIYVYILYHMLLINDGIESFTLRYSYIIMYLDFEKQENILIITLSGELDHNSAEEVRVRIDDRIDRDNIEKVILNFSGVTFMDSSGIGAVLGRYKKLSNKGGQLCIAKPNKNVNRIFELAGLYKIIKNYNTVDEAVRCI